MLMAYGLRKSYDGRRVLDGVTLDIADGEVVALIGPSGSGKSTLLRCLIGLEHCDTGTVRLDAGRRMGMVFQDFNLFNHLTVVENVMFAPRRLLGLSQRAAMRQALTLLRSVGLVGRSRALVDELSGGERQRVAIARALAMKPDMLLMDEPTSALDPAMRGEVEAVIGELVKKGMTMVIATHDLHFARSVASRCLLVDDGHVYEALNEHTRRFLRRAQVLSEPFSAHTFDFYGFLGRLEAYLGRRAASRERMRSLRLVMEELLLNLVPSVTATAQLVVSAAGSQRRGPVTTTITWRGGRGDPFAVDDADLAIAARIVSRQCSHAFSSSDDGVRRLEVVFAAEDVGHA